MANPQKENGYTPIANEICDKLRSIDISKGESKILWTIFRATYGWNKKEDQISISQFQEITGMTRRGVCGACASLVNRRILGREQKGTSFVTKYWIQKDLDKWIASEQPCTREQPFPKTRERTRHLLGNGGAPTKDNTKDSIKTVAPARQTRSVKTKVFIKPAVSDIRAYCQERKNNIDPQYFFDKNESLGWVTGKNQMPIKDWKAVIRIWESYDKRPKDVPVAHSKLPDRL